MSKIRFVTAMAVGATACESLIHEVAAVDGISTPVICFDWLVVEAFTRRLPSGALSPKWRGLALVSAGAGLRPGEARGLTGPWVWFLKREIRVEHQLWTPQTGESYMIRPKRGSVGTVPVDDAVIKGLAMYLEEVPASESLKGVSGQEELLLFTNRFGKRMSEPVEDTMGRRAVPT